MESLHLRHTTMEPSDLCHTTMEPSDVYHTITEPLDSWKDDRDWDTSMFEKAVLLLMRCHAIMEKLDSHQRCATTPDETNTVLVYVGGQKVLWYHDRDTSSLQLICLALQKMCSEKASYCLSKYNSCVKLAMGQDDDTQCKGAQNERSILQKVPSLISFIMQNLLKDVLCSKETRRWGLSDIFVRLVEKLREQPWQRSKSHSCPLADVRIRGTSPDCDISGEKMSQHESLSEKTVAQETITTMNDLQKVHSRECSLPEDAAKIASEQKISQENMAEIASEQNISQDNVSAENASEQKTSQDTSLDIRSEENATQGNTLETLPKSLETVSEEKATQEMTFETLSKSLETVSEGTTPQNMSVQVATEQKASQNMSEKTVSEQTTSQDNITVGILSEELTSEVTSLATVSEQKPSQDMSVKIASMQNTSQCTSLETVTEQNTSQDTVRPDNIPTLPKGMPPENIISDMVTKATTLSRVSQNCHPGLSEPNRQYKMTSWSPYSDWSEKMASSTVESPPYSADILAEAESSTTTLANIYSISKGFTCYESPVTSLDVSAQYSKLSFLKTSEASEETVLSIVGSPSTHLYIPAEGSQCSRLSSVSTSETSKETVSSTVGSHSTTLDKSGESMSSSIVYSATFTDPKEVSDTSEEGVSFSSLLIVNSLEKVTGARRMSPKSMSAVAISPENVTTDVPFNTLSPVTSPAMSTETMTHRTALSDSMHDNSMQTETSLHNHTPKGNTASNSLAKTISHQTVSEGFANDNDNLIYAMNPEGKKLDTEQMNKAGTDKETGLRPTSDLKTHSYSTLQDVCYRSEGSSKTSCPQHVCSQSPKSAANDFEPDESDEEGMENEFQKGPQKVKLLQTKLMFFLMEQTLQDLLKTKQKLEELCTKGKDNLALFWKYVCADKNLLKDFLTTKSKYADCLSTFQTVLQKTKEELDRQISGIGDQNSTSALRENSHSANNSVSSFSGKDVLDEDPEMWQIHQTRGEQFEDHGSDTASQTEGMWYPFEHEAQGTEKESGDSSMDQRNACVETLPTFLTKMSVDDVQFLQFQLLQILERDEFVQSNLVVGVECTKEILKDTKEKLQQCLYKNLHDPVVVHDCINTLVLLDEDVWKIKTILEKSFQSVLFCKRLYVKENEQMEKSATSNTATDNLTQRQVERDYPVPHIRPKDESNSLISENSTMCTDKLQQIQCKQKQNEFPPCIHSVEIKSKELLQPKVPLSQRRTPLSPHHALSKHLMPFKQRVHSFISSDDFELDGVSQSFCQMPSKKHSVFRNISDTTVSDSNESIVTTSIPTPYQDEKTSAEQKQDRNKRLAGNMTFHGTDNDEPVSKKACLSDASIVTNTGHWTNKSTDVITVSPQPDQNQTLSVQLKSSLQEIEDMNLGWISRHAALCPRHCTHRSTEHAHFSQHLSTEENKQMSTCSNRHGDNHVQPEENDQLRALSDQHEKRRTRNKDTRERSGTLTANDVAEKEMKIRNFSELQESDSEDVKEDSDDDVRLVIDMDACQTAFNDRSRAESDSDDMEIVQTFCDAERIVLHPIRGNTDKSGGNMSEHFGMDCDETLYHDTTVEKLDTRKWQSAESHGLLTEQQHMDTAMHTFGYRHTDIDETFSTGNENVSDKISAVESSMYNDATLEESTHQKKQQASLIHPDDPTTEEKSDDTKMNYYPLKIEFFRSDSEREENLETSNQSFFRKYLQAARKTKKSLSVDEETTGNMQTGQAENKECPNFMKHSVSDDHKGNAEEACPDNTVLECHLQKTPTLQGGDSSGMADKAFSPGTEMAQHPQVAAPLPDNDSTRTPTKACSSNTEMAQHFQSTSSLQDNDSIRKPEQALSSGITKSRLIGNTHYQVSVNSSLESLQPSLGTRNYDEGTQTRHTGYQQHDTSEKQVASAISQEKEITIRDIDKIFNKYRKETESQKALRKSYPFSHKGLFEPVGDLYAIERQTRKELNECIATYRRIIKPAGYMVKSGRRPGAPFIKVIKSSEDSQSKQSERKKKDAETSPNKISPAPVITSDNQEMKEEGCTKPAPTNSGEKTVWIKPNTTDSSKKKGWTKFTIRVNKEKRGWTALDITDNTKNRKVEEMEVHADEEDKGRTKPTTSSSSKERGDKEMEESAIDNLHGDSRSPQSCGVSDEDSISSDNELQLSSEEDAAGLLYSQRILMKDWQYESLRQAWNSGYCDEQEMENLAQANTMPPTVVKMWFARRKASRQRRRLRHKSQHDKESKLPKQKVQDGTVLLSSQTRSREVFGNNPWAPHMDILYQTIADWWRGDPEGLYKQIPELVKFTHAPLSVFQTWIEHLKRTEGTEKDRQEGPDVHHDGPEVTYTESFECPLPPRETAAEQKEGKAADESSVAGCDDGPKVVNLEDWQKSFLSAAFEENRHPSADVIKDYSFALNLPYEVVQEQYRDMLVAEKEKLQEAVKHTREMTRQAQLVAEAQAEQAQLRAQLQRLQEIQEQTELEAAIKRSLEEQ